MDGQRHRSLHIFKVLWKKSTRVELDNRAVEYRGFCPDRVVEKALQGGDILYLGLKDAKESTTGPLEGGTTHTVK